MPSWQKLWLQKRPLVKLIFFCQNLAKNDFWPKYQNFGDKIWHFQPWRSPGPSRLMFSTRKRCLIGYPRKGYPKSCSLPPKIGFSTQKQPNMPPNMYVCLFWPTNGLYGQFDAMPDLKMRSRYNESDNFFWLHSLKCFQSPIKLLCISQKTTGYAQKWQLWPNICIKSPFWIDCAPNLAAMWFFLQNSEAK